MAFQSRVSELVEVVSGQLVSGPDIALQGVGTDSRTELSGKLFIALKGESFDGHDFLRAAAEQQAAGVLFHGREQDWFSEFPDTAFIQVKDTLEALQVLGLFWRRKLSASVVGITGSMGKTSTKDFAYTILEKSKKVHASVKSFNNHWGVPFTLLAADLDSQVVLLEMGMNHAGELETLSKLSEPDIVVCTTVGRSHVGHFADGILGVAAAKEEIYSANPQALKIYNGDNEYTLKMFENARQKWGIDNTRVFSSFAAGAEVGFRAVTMDLESLQISGHICGVPGNAKVSVFGRHNVVNLMAAASIAVSVGMEPEAIWQRLPYCQMGWGRNQLLEGPKGCRILFDAYNANPDSVAMLIKNIFEIPPREGGKKVAILGEMLELGDESRAAHQALGEMLAQTDMELVYFQGPSAEHFKRGFGPEDASKKLIISNSYEESLAKKLGSMLNPSDIVVVKGSRGMHLEKVVQAWGVQI